MGVTVKGLSQMKSNLRKIAKEFPQLTGRAVRAEAEIEMTEMKRRTPVRHGTLRDSGHVEGPEISSNGKIAVSMNFGGLAEDYAIPVHENLEAFHKVGQAKFAESVLLESRPFMAERIVERVKLEKIKL